MGAGQISFGPFVLDRSAQTLLSGGKPIALGQRALALLDALASADGPVGKAALIEAAWPGTIVEEGNLTVQIAALRKALGSRPDGGEWIVTLPRVGYRLVHGDVSAAQTADEWRSVLPSLAVLPFQNLSADPTQDYFADSVVEDIITALSRFKSFGVIARNSSFVYKGRAIDVRDVARDLGARYVLEGSVRVAGSRFRVTAQLVDAETGDHIWASHFDGGTENVFDVQDRITAQVAGIVNPKVRAAEVERAQRKRADRLSAYDLFMLAHPKQRRRHISDNDQVYELLMRSVELDPHYGPALAELAFTLDTRFSMGWESTSHDDRRRSVEFARRAILHADGDANVMATASIVLLHAKHYDEAMRVTTAALETNPNDRVVMSCAAIVHLHVGDIQQSLALTSRAQELGANDGGSHWILTAMAHAYMVLGNFTEAIRWAERSHVVNAEIDPTFWVLIAAHAQLGRMDEARNWLAAFLAIHPDMTISRIRSAQPERYPDRMAAILEGLRLAGLPES
jgi:TolB-like protein